MLGLRGQLIVGLSLMVVVATVSVGVITRWDVGRQLTSQQQARAAALARAVSAVVSSTFAPRLRRARLEHVVTLLRAQRVLSLVEVFDSRMRVLVRAPSSAQPAATLLVRSAIRRRRALARTIAPTHVEAAAPMLRGGVLLGAVRLRVPLGGRGLGASWVFWLVIGVDALALVLFVAFVITRYVAQPIGAMQRAAAAVAAGDLDVRLDEGGPPELASLSGSFNAMTRSLREQLERLEAQRRSLIRSEKLASVGRLAAGVAHEVGNPLQSIIGFADILLGAEANDERRDFLQRLQSEAERIHEIIRQLLDYSRPADEGRRSAVALSAVVRQAVRLVRPQERFRSVEVVDKGLADAPLADASEPRLVQVVVNLLLNAADAMDGKGRVVLRTGTNDGCVSLFVANDGPQIPSADRDRIFDPFFTTKDPGKGTGLGLAVSHAIAESFDGELSLVDEEATTFELRLPVWRAAPRLAVVGEQPAEGA